MKKVSGKSGFGLFVVSSREGSAIVLWDRTITWVTKKKPACHSCPHVMHHPCLGVRDDQFQSCYNNTLDRKMLPNEIQEKPQVHCVLHRGSAEYSRGVQVGTRAGRKSKCEVSTCWLLHSGRGCPKAVTRD